MGELLCGWATAAARVARLAVNGTQGVRAYSALFAIDLKTRCVHLAGIAHEPDGAWMEQVARNLTDAVDGFLHSPEESAAASGAPATGGATGTSGGMAAGGSSGTGATAGGGARGSETVSTGGAAGAGGLPASGGNGGRGGDAATGGVSLTGGSPTTGGSATGGSSPTGGSTGSGGSGGAAGAPETGGSGAESGAAASGGTGGAAGAISMGGSGAEPGEDIIITIRNGDFWNDTAGNRIEAHGGGFYQEGDTWYWVGEDKSHNAATFRAVNCYASTDLSNWEFRNAIVTRDTAPELDASDRIIERPKVVSNDTTGQYVMWLHWEGQNYAEAEAGVFTSDTIDGDYTYRASFRPNGNMSRDDTLFKDDDGKAYFISAANENADLAIYELTADYLDIARQVSTLWISGWREAPAMFKHDGRYYLITSAATGWDPNQARYASATSIEGPWTELSELGDSVTYDTQPTYVIPVRGTRTTTYIYAGDRWQDPDLGSSKYIWLPLKLGDTTLALDYYDVWNLNVTTGEWWVDDGYLPQSGWSVLFVSSEEVSGEDGAAANAFDDSASTYWHSSWDTDTFGHPHELQIDLGSNYLLEALRYLPRQDADNHGMVADYELYVSLDPADWGSPVATGNFGTGRTATLVSFAPTLGRYVRFVALSEINGQAWASVAELDLVGTAQ